jgi:hypothetical protein
MSAGPCSVYGHPSTKLRVFIVSQQSDTQCSISQGESCHQAKKYLKEDLILPELSDNLSDVPEDVF